MNKLYKDYENLKNQLIDALVEKDYLEIYQASILKNEFVLKLGEPRYELHKLEMAIARNKLKLDMMETSTRFQIQIDAEYIDRQLEKEFEKHDIMLKSMKREIDNVHNLTEHEEIDFETLRVLKELYLSIARYIHPELTPESDKSKKRTWKAAKAAFEKRDIAKLKRLHKKVMGEFSDAEINDGSEALEKEIESLKAKTDTVLSEIENIKKQFPFNEEKMLEDETAVSKFRNDMDKDIKVAKEVLDKLEKQILEKLPAPGGYLN